MTNNVTDLHGRKTAKRHDFCKGAEAVPAVYPDIVEKAKYIVAQVRKDIIASAANIKPVWQPSITCSVCGTAHLTPALKEMWTHLGKEMSRHEKEKFMLEVVVQLLEEQI